MKGWTTRPLVQICKIRGGKRLPEGHILQQAGTDHPYIKARDIRGGKIGTTDLEFLSPATYEHIKRYIVHVGDVCITIVANIGDVGIVPPALNNANLTENAVRLTEFTQDAVSSFVNYALSAPFYKKYMETLAAGAAQSKLGIYKIERIKLPLPHPHTQRKVAAVLSAYDDQIENSNRRIAILEKMGAELYREWFVRLRFPGYEKVKIVKGVPEGWEVVRLGKICYENRIMAKKKNISDETIYIGLEHIPQHAMMIAETGYAVDVQSDKLIFTAGDILFGKIRPYLHKISMVHFEGVCSSDTIVIKPVENIYQAFTYYTISSNSFIDLATISSTGTKMPRADWDFLTKQKIILPESKLLAIYQAMFDKQYSAMAKLQNQITILSISRDRLLSRLMSGKIDVEKMDIRFPESMLKEVAISA